MLLSTSTHADENEIKSDLMFGALGRQAAETNSLRKQTKPPSGSRPLSFGCTHAWQRGDTWLDSSLARNIITSTLYHVITLYFYAAGNMFNTFLHFHSRLVYIAVFTV